ncbi:IniB N-terminal domain-containing protein [Nucisporomicrobium flavum]|uniref:IniB N-terminal domain-containing protein n=1 Tax=Nucisporomicrobium flavum TaxID=2785915 RepID=UPI0018F29068|nr:IniB N-terminal domain-containing protein [Nucisporomicrobium flavum]
MDSSPTLQDFVLNLIYDPVARSAFEHDPEGVLQDAGLEDVTAADVQEVIPLVVDFAPLADVAAVTAPLGVSEVTSGVADVDVTGAVTHLQLITAQLSAAHPATATELSVAGAGTVVVAGDGLLPQVAAVNVVGVEQVVTVPTPSVPAVDDALSVVHDPGLGLDAGVSASTGVAATVVTDSDHLIASTGVDAGATLDTTVHSVTGVTSAIDVAHVTDLDVAHLDPAVSSVVGSVTGSDPLGGVSHDAVHSVTGIADGATHTVGGLVDGLGHHTAPDAGHDAHGAVTDLLF